MRARNSVEASEWTSLAPVCPGKGGREGGREGGSVVKILYIGLLCVVWLAVHSDNQPAKHIT